MRNTGMRNTVIRLLLAAFAAAWILPLAALAQDVPEPGALALHAAAEYRKASRYPADSKVLPAGAEDPVRAKLRVSPVTARGRDGEVTSLSVWTGKLSYEAGEPVDVFATGAGSEVLAITGEVRTERGETVGPLAFFDDGVGADQVAGDGIYSARLPVAESLRPELAESHLVTVQASFANAETRHAAGGYLLSNPWARLTGRYRDRVVKGDVVVSAEVEVTRAGRFHLAGTLHTLAGEPIGTAQAARELEVGRHWIDLAFYGLMFHDRKVRGPFRVGSLSLRTASGMPNALSELAEDVHVTHAVPLKRLTSRPANDPGLLRAAAVLEAEAARSRGVAKD